MRAPMAVLFFLAVVVVVVGCSGSDPTPGDAGLDAGRQDAGTRDASPAPVDAGADASGADASGPGPDGGGPDAGLLDASRPDGSTDCTGTVTSDLPGVRVEYVPQRCTFTLAEAAAGIDIDYAVVVDAPLASVTVRPQDAGGCGAPGPSGLVTFEQLAGGAQRYCLCDTGLCPGGDRTVALAAGSYPASFHWTGRNWGGPSDTGMPMGAPFPAGDYTLRVSAIGSYASASFTVASTFPIHLVP